MKIRSKLVSFILIFSSLPLIAFIIISFYFSQNNAVKDALSKNSLRTEVVKSEIIGLINESFMGIKQLAKDPSIREFDQQKVKPLLVDSLKLNPTTFDFVVVKSNGGQFAKATDSALTSVADRNYFKLAVKGQEEVVSEILISQSTGMLQTVLATPIRDKDGVTVIGTVQAPIKLEKLNDFVKTLSKDNVNVYVLDSTGKMLANPTQSFKNLEDRTDLSSLSFVSKAQAGASGSEEITIDGKQMLVSYAQDKRTGWIIYSEIAKSVAIKDSVKSSVVTTVVGIIILILACSIAFILSGYSVKPLQALVAAANDISEGKLNIENLKTQSKDEIGTLGKAFEKMVINLQQMVTSIQQYSLNVSNASDEMIAASEQQSSTAASTANNSNEIVKETENLNLSINKTSSSVTNLSKAIENINKKSANVSSMVEVASNQSDMGSKKLLKVNSTMKDIEQSVNDTALVINKLDEHSKAIGNITEVIKGISEQTNLLALNAAIEAARAGEQGKGFAVVADEVRKLAEQSGEAAGQVSNLISGIQNETKNAVDVMSKGIREVKDGTVVIEDANAYFQQIFAAIQQISNSISEVNAAVSIMEQEEKDIEHNLEGMVKLSDKVNAEVQSISAATEEQLASIEEMTASAQSLGEMAMSLNDLTSKFKTE